MKIFYYKAKKTPTEIVTGELEAESLNEAANKLKCSLLFPIEITEKGSNYFQSNKNINLPDKQLVFFTREVADLLNSGVSLIDSIKLISKQTNNNKLKKISNFIFDKLKEGKSFSKALSSFPSVFSNLYINIINTGEHSGSLSQVMNRLAKYYESNNKLRSKIKQSLVYPAFLMTMGVLSVAILVLFVIPKITPMFDDIGIELPLITKYLIKISDFFAHYGYLLLIIVTALFLLSIKFIKFNQIKILLQNFFIHIPLSKKFIINMHLSEILQSLESMLSNGVSMIKALEISTDNCLLPIIREPLLTIIDETSNGKSLSTAFMTKKIFPEKVAMVIKVGEESGKISAAMKKLSESYAQEFNTMSEFIMTFIGPFFILIMAIFIGVIVIAMLLPILSMNNAI